MNRAERRKLPPAIRELVDNLDTGCPDCHSTARLRQDTEGCWHLDISHDQTCPWLAAQERNHHE